MWKIEEKQPRYKEYIHEKKKNEVHACFTFIRIHILILISLFTWLIVCCCIFYLATGDGILATFQATWMGGEQQTRYGKHKIVELSILLIGYDVIGCFFFRLFISFFFQLLVMSEKCSSCTYSTIKKKITLSKAKQLSVERYYIM